MFWLHWPITKSSGDRKDAAASSGSMQPTQSPHGSPILDFEPMEPIATKRKPSNWDVLSAMSNLHRQKKTFHHSHRCKTPRNNNSHFTRSKNTPRTRLQLRKRQKQF